MMVLGGGAGLMALDAVSRLGGRPANFFDMTSTTGQVEEKVYRAVKTFLRVERLRGLLIGSNIGAFLPVSIRLRGIARGLRETLPARGRFPVVIRLAGIGDNEAAPLLADLPVSYFRDEVMLEDAVAVFMAKLEGGA
jgi:succinyl-CoA synthetase beta subunit